MINSKSFPRFVLSLFLAVLTIAAPPGLSVPAQQPAQNSAAAGTAPDLTARLAAIEKSIDDKRKEFGIPGVSLVIVQNDKVIYMKGLGVKDFENNVAVTPDTLFAIGSATKAFTAMAAVMSADKGRLSLDDSPKKYLPYFKMRDADTDAKITIRDLLSHRSGLNRTDLAMVTNRLNREELIKVAGMAKPTAKLGEKFQYQNVMYAAAGEVVAKAEHSDWDQVMADRIFKPLGMTSTNTTVRAMQKAKDFSFGYEYNSTTKQTRRLPQREIPSAAPAGAINSSARDMAQWLRLMLGGGVFNGQRLVSEQGFNQLITKQINVAGTVDYGLGWFLRQWNEHKVIEHGGNIDGFNAQVAMMPDQKLGFVLLTNVTASPLVGIAMSTVWNNLVGQPQPAAEQAAAPAADPKKATATAASSAPAEATDEAQYSGPMKELFGSYEQEQSKGIIEIGFREGKVSLLVPGQQVYPLVEKEVNKLSSPMLPDTYWIDITRNADGGVAGIVMNQPEGKFPFRRMPDTAALISTDDLITKMIAAYGGEENLRKHKSSITTIEVDMENQGVQAEGVVRAKAPNMQATNVTLTALGREIGSSVSYFDGTSGGQMPSFAPEEILSGKRLQDVKIETDFYRLLNWKKNFKTINVKRIAKVGDEDAYVVEKLPQNGHPVTDYISTKSFLLLRRDTVIASETSPIELPQTEKYSDYRTVEGVMVAFKILANNLAYGDIVTRVKEIKFDVDVPDSIFHKPVKK
jgi:CubicO group peptidase (beta-lactamase class C family)